MPKLRKCPFCKAELDEKDINYNGLMKKWVLSHWCKCEKDEHMGIIFSAPGKEELVEMWNGTRNNTKE